MIGTRAADSNSLPPLDVGAAAKYIAAMLERTAVTFLCVGATLALGGLAGKILWPMAGAVSLIGFGFLALALLTICWAACVEVWRDG